MVFLDQLVTDMLMLLTNTDAAVRVGTCVCPGCSTGFKLGALVGRFEGVSDTSTLGNPPKSDGDLDGETFGLLALGLALGLIGGCQEGAIESHEGIIMGSPIGQLLRCELG